MRKLRASILVVAATAFCLAQTATEYESPTVMHVAGMLNCNCGCKLRMDCVMPPSGLCPVCKAAKMRIANMQKAGTSDSQILDQFVSESGAGFWPSRRVSLGLLRPTSLSLWVWE